MRALIKKHQAEIVHAHLFEAVLLSRLATPSPVKFYFTIHNVLSKDAFEVNRLSKIAESLTYKKKHFLIAVSKDALDDYDKWIGIKGPSTVLYNYVHQKYFDLNYDANRQIEGDFKLVAVGNLRRQKNYPALLEAFKILKEEPVSLDIYGSGEQKEELESSISAEGLKVRVMGRVNDVSEVLPQYHAYIMASLFEGFGIAPMEAMAAGMPVILSDLAVFRELGEDLPQYFDPQNPQSIAESIMFLYRNWEAAKTRAKKGRDLICNKASREVYFKKLSEIYHRSEEN
jgi:glycosyltransferase involved in cell wall biosynthesis